MQQKLKHLSGSQIEWWREELRIPVGEIRNARERTPVVPWRESGRMCGALREEVGGNPEC